MTRTELVLHSVLSDPEKLWKSGAILLGHRPTLPGHDSVRLRRRQWSSGSSTRTGSILSESEVVRSRQTSAARPCF
jgi:hypothetical protein